MTDQSEVYQTDLLERLFVPELTLGLIAQVRDYYRLPVVVCSDDKFMLHARRFIKQRFYFYFCQIGITLYLIGLFLCVKIFFSEEERNFINR